jgi:hypothetical protein
VADLLFCAKQFDFVWNVSFPQAFLGCARCRREIDPDRVDPSIRGGPPSEGSIPFVGGLGFDNGEPGQANPVTAQESL